MVSLTEDNLLEQLNRFSQAATAIRLKHTTVEDQKLLADPILDYEIALTPKLLQFGNIQSLCDVMAQGGSNQVDMRAEDLGLGRKLLGSKATLHQQSTARKLQPTVPQSSRLTVPSATAKSAKTNVRKQSVRSTARSTRRSISREAAMTQKLPMTKTMVNLRQSAASKFMDPPKPKVVPQQKAQTRRQSARIARMDASQDQNRSLSSHSNPVLKPGVTAEDLANRLLGHKLHIENKIKAKQQQQQEEIRAQRQLQLNVEQNEKFLGANFAPIQQRVDQELQKKQTKLQSLQQKVAIERKVKEDKEKQKEYVGAEKLIQQRLQQRREQIQQKTFDADYFELKYKKELEERQRKQQIREKQKVESEIDPRVCSFQPNIAPKSTAIAKQVTLKSKSRSRNRDINNVYHSTASVVKSKSPVVKTITKKRTQSRQGEKLTERLSKQQQPRRKSPVKPDEVPTFKPALNKKSKKIASKKGSPLRDVNSPPKLAPSQSSKLQTMHKHRGSVSPMQMPKTTMVVQNLTPASNRTQQNPLLGSRLETQSNGSIPHFPNQGSMVSAYQSQTQASQTARYKQPAPLAQPQSSSDLLNLLSNFKGSVIQLK